MIKILNSNGSETLYQSSEAALVSGVSQSVIDELETAKKWRDITGSRTQLLFETDWTQGQDSPLSSEKITEFAAYRQALRDIPQTFTTPEDVVWPDKPNLG